MISTIRKIQNKEPTLFVCPDIRVPCMWSNQRIYISDRRVSPPFVVRRKHSPNLSPLCLQYLTIPVRLYNCRQSRQREVGRVLPSDNQGGVRTLLSLIYILWVKRQVDFQKYRCISMRVEEDTGRASSRSRDSARSWWSRLSPYQKECSEFPSTGMHTR